MAVFRKMLDDNTSEVAEFLHQFGDTADEDYPVDNTDVSDEEEEVDICDAGFDDVASASTVLETSIPAVDSTIDSYGVNVLKFPIDFSQGSVDGRNGSSACSIIALVIAQVIADHPHLQTPTQGTISPLWCTLLYHSMISGNRIYDRYRSNLPARYLSAAEAYDILTRHENFAIEPEEPLPVRLVDEHRLSTIEAQPELLAETPQRKLAVFTISERTSLFFIQTPDIMFFDTRCHLPDGGVVVLVGQCNRLNSFCASIWDLEGFDVNTFGNLAILKVPEK